MVKKRKKTKTAKRRKSKGVPARTKSVVKRTPRVRRSVMRSI